MAQTPLLSARARSEDHSEYKSLEPTVESLDAEENHQQPRVENPRIAFIVLTRNQTVVLSPAASRLLIAQSAVLQAPVQLAPDVGPIIRWPVECSSAAFKCVIQILEQHAARPERNESCAAYPPGYLLPRPLPSNWQPGCEIALLITSKLPTHSMKMIVLLQELACVCYKLQFEWLLQHVCAILAQRLMALGPRCVLACIQPTMSLLVIETTLLQHNDPTLQTQMIRFRFAHDVHLEHLSDHDIQRKFSQQPEEVRQKYMDLAQKRIREWPRFHAWENAVESAAELPTPYDGDHLFTLFSNPGGKRDLAHLVQEVSEFIGNPPVVPATVPALSCCRVVCVRPFRHGQCCCSNTPLLLYLLCLGIGVWAAFIALLLAPPSPISSAHLESHSFPLSSSLPPPFAGAMLMSDKHAASMLQSYYFFMAFLIACIVWLLGPCLLCSFDCFQHCNCCYGLLNYCEAKSRVPRSLDASGTRWLREEMSWMDPEQDEYQVFSWHGWTSPELLTQDEEIRSKFCIRPFFVLFFGLVIMAWIVASWALGADPYLSSSTSHRTDSVAGGHWSAGLPSCSDGMQARVLTSSSFLLSHPLAALDRGAFECMPVRPWLLDDAEASYNSIANLSSSSWSVGGCSQPGVEDPTSRWANLDFNNQTFSGVWPCLSTLGKQQCYIIQYTSIVAAAALSLPLICALIFGLRTVCAGKNK
jgi:hypothetical protein